MAQGIKAQQIDDLAKGINLFTRDTMLKENESKEGFNVWAVGKNSLAKRPGIVKLCTIPGATQVDGIGTYTSGTTRELLAMSNGVLYKVETGTAVALSAAPASCNVFTTGKRTDFCQAGGKVYVANAQEDIRVYDGTAIRPQTGAIVAQYMIFYKGCLWAAGNQVVGNETKLYRSGNDANIGNFTNSTANPIATSTYISQSDGVSLKGLFKHQDYLYPVKEKSLWRTSVGTDALQLITSETIDPARGCGSHFSIDTVDNDNFMFNEMGIYATGYEPNILDQIRTNIVSLRIDPKLKAIQKTRLDDVVGIYYDNHYYLSYTSGGGTYNDTIMVYDRQRLGWWEWQVSDASGNLTGANCFTEYKDTSGQTRLYFGSATDGSIYYFDDTAKQDAGWTIVTDWKSKRFSFGDYSQMKFFFQMLIYVGELPGDITINVYIDGVLTHTQQTQIGDTGIAGMGLETFGMETIGLGGGTLEVSDSGGGNFIKIPLNKLGRDIQVEISDNNGTKGFEINALHFQYRPLTDAFQPGTL